MDIEDLRQKAGSGSVAAQSILGICYLDGIDVEVNYNEAFRLLTAAAERRAPRAIYHLGRMYADGLGIKKDLPKAIRLYEAAAKAGEFLAQIALARIFSRGVDVPADADAARRWYSAAAAQDNVADSAELREAKDYIASL